MSLARLPLSLARLPLRVARLLSFAAFFLWELVLANARVAWEVVTPTHYMRAGIVAVPTHARSDLEAVVLANLITLTPGTLTLEISEDRSVLFIHSLYVSSPEEFRHRIARFEQRMLKALR